MIYLIGDTHGEDSRFREGPFLGDGAPKKGDYLIVSGDFGFVFYTPGTVNYVIERERLDALSELPYTILFVDGNHENFDRLGAFEVEEWCGGKVHKIRPNIIHLMRGQVFTIEGKKIFTMGGGYSMDKASRREGFSWWREEMPSNEDYREATKNLLANDNRVDFIVTHTAPREIVYAMGTAPDPHEEELNGFFDWVAHDISYEKWYFGHWHRDAEYYGRFRAVYFDLLTLN